MARGVEAEGPYIDSEAERDRLVQEDRKGMKNRPHKPVRMRNRARKEAEMAGWYYGRPGSAHSKRFVAIVDLYSQLHTESPTERELRRLDSLRCWKSAPQPLEDAKAELELELVTLGLSGIACEVDPRTGRRASVHFRRGRNKKHNRTEGK